MTAFFTDEEKLAAIRTMLSNDVSEAAALSDMERAILEAIAADYETKIAGVTEFDDDGPVQSADEHAVKTIAGGFTPIKSSNLASAKYDSTTGEMTVRFRNNTCYIYFGVDGDTYRAVIAAESPGKAFHDRIVKHGFRHERLTDWRE